MAKIVKITPTQQYNIDKIREYRLELGLSGPEVSVGINKDPSYIGQAESARSDLFYTDPVMNEIAHFFSEKAQEMREELKKIDSKRKVKTKYSIHDFYPKKPLPDIRQTKTINPIPKGFGPTVTLNAVIETPDFFNRSRTLKEVVDYCNSFDHKNWGESDFTATLDRAIEKGKLEKSYAQDGKARYGKAK